MTKERYAKMLNLIPHEAMQILKDEADAERLVDGIFGPQGGGSCCGKSGKPGSRDLVEAMMLMVMEFAREAYPVRDA
jgi:hypothetical protein